MKRFAAVIGGMQLEWVSRDGADGQPPGPISTESKVNGFTAVGLTWERISHWGRRLEFPCSPRGNRRACPPSPGTATGRTPTSAASAAASLSLNSRCNWSLEFLGFVDSISDWIRSAFLDDRPPIHLQWKTQWNFIHLVQDSASMGWLRPPTGGPAPAPEKEVGDTRATR